jgi:outer membrane protein assembly factor BamB
MHLNYLLSLALIPFAAAPGDAWPQFRGPHGAGRSDARGLPLHWSETDNVRWKTAIHGKGWSSPVVWGNQVWLATARPDGKELYGMCVDRNSGKVLHDLLLFTDEKPAFCHAFNSYASPTPAIEEGRVYLHFGSAGTACVDTASGKTIWTRRDFPCNHWRGPGSSPVLFQDLLFLTFDGYDHQYVVALDKRTGSTVWRKDRSIPYGTNDGDAKKAYGTPTVIEVAGRPQLVSPSAVGTIAYDPPTGEEIWMVKHGGMNVAQPPIYGDGLLYLCTGDGGFRLYALRPEGRGDLTQTRVEWKHNRNAPSRCGPLLADGLLFFNNEAGVVTCLESKTGKEVWTERLKGRFSASPLLAEGRMYFCSEDGPTYVVEAGRTWKLLATNPLADGFMASPAVAGKSLILRTKTHLYCIEDKNADRQ